MLDLSKRKTEYQYKDRQTGKEVSGTCQATITKEEADKYTYENMIPGNDGWNPRIMMEKLGSPRSLVYQQGTLKWNPVKMRSDILYMMENRFSGRLLIPLSGVGSELCFEGICRESIWNAR